MSIRTEMPRWAGLRRGRGSLGRGHARRRRAAIGRGRRNRVSCVTTPPADRRLEPVCAGRSGETAPPAEGSGRVRAAPSQPRGSPPPTPSARAPAPPPGTRILCPHARPWPSHSSSSVASFMSRPR
ncbi:uncharacterized protein LOC141488810 [Macrotis lagotis]|uniref:uncharacterized protein LOC141488810 n=1 Tax=Macrotis lagotis TaxID=92651 RepID=UPI003D690440